MQGIYTDMYYYVHVQTRINVTENCNYHRLLPSHTANVRSKRALTDEVMSTMLVSQTSPMGAELVSYVNAFFFSNKLNFA